MSATRTAPVPAPPELTSRRRVTQWMARHPFATFVGLTYTISWSLWLAAFLIGDGSPVAAVVFVAGAFGPALAGAATLVITGGSLGTWARSIVRWRVPVRFWLYALGLPAALFAAANVLLLTLGQPIEWSLAGGRLVPYLGTFVMTLFFLGAQEEPGWRGYALPRLQQRYTPVRATLILGVVWGLWHLPVAGPAGAIVPFVLAFFYTYLYNRTGSVLLAILLHASFTPAQEHLILTPATVHGASDAAIGLAYLAGVVLLLVSTRGRLGFDAEANALRIDDDHASSATAVAVAPGRGHRAPATTSRDGDEHSVSPRSARSAVALVAAMVASVIIALLPFLWTPAVVPATAAPDTFSAARALQDLRAVASAPRSMGTPAHAAALETIQQRLAAMGVQSEIVEDVVASPDFNQVFAGRLRNVIARIPGTDSSGGVILFSHFDSLPTSPNANDGGLGVATVLETVRAIRAGPTPANDLILWFGDADETTALNSLALLRHPWMDDARFGMAFEATGVRGASILTFAGQGNPAAGDAVLAIGQNEGVSLSRPQLSPENGRWLREALRVVPAPVVGLQLNDIGMGVSPDLGRAMMGADQVLGGVSFAQIGDPSGYHTDLDRPDRVSPSSLQHSGDNALALTRHFAAFDFDTAVATSGVVAFNVLPGVVVTYPFGVAVPLSLVAVIVLGTAVLVGKRRRELTVSGVVMGMVLTIVSVAVAVGLALVSTRLLDPGVHFARIPYGPGWRMLLLAMLSLTSIAAVFLLAGRLLKRAARVAALAAGPLVVLTFLAVLTAVAVPSLSYVFLLPALAGAALLAWRVLRPRTADRPWRAVAGLVMVAATVALAAVPLVYMVASAAPIAMAAPIVAIVATLLAGALVPHLQHLSGDRAWVVPLALAVAAGGFVAGERVTGTFDHETPRPNYIHYTVDRDTDTASWLSTGTRPDAWTEQFFADGYTVDRRAFSPGYYFDQQFDIITTAAPALDLPAPQVDVVSDAASEGIRTLHLRVRSRRAAPMVHLDLSLPGDLVAARVEDDDLRVDQTQGLRRFPIAIYNPGDRGLDVTISIRSTEPVTGTLTDFSNGLPDVPGIDVRDRPPEFMPAPFDFRDPTVVRTSVRL
jgi:membrane protease YdiL (CAAX protease family)